jgi:hypothetical protein
VPPSREFRHNGFGTLRAGAVSMRGVNLSDICSIQGNKACADALSIIAITRHKEHPQRETAFIDRICSLHFCARCNSVRVGNAEREP